ncbi:lysophospholipid transporter LplT [Paenibacillus sp. N1-5-1-14]|uniref:lysophospholipid transporter LplT n=1 Tax=Paenibacillus radicibacter TaxID=2972488 RepID=UPI0021593D63|nr:lysophospholipid transporter LplT [Paenibacillus radicibacter]MCR8641039.1 lysophospholipid transporter LplT [Paenibacillus radicibacter]
MPKPLTSLVFTQFISSFADNVNFFIIIGIITRQGVSNPEGYVLNIQMGFLLAYVVLAPLVGAYADRNSKSNVLLMGNLLKSIGIGMLLLGIHPIACYAVLGIGAVVYSPAKYGILTELTNSEKGLLRANALVEGTTILAILLGTVAGGILADISDTVGVITCLITYIISLLLTLLIPRLPGNKSLRYGQSSLEFFKDFKQLIRNKKARFSLIGTGAFWLTASVLRIALIAWIPANLGITDTTSQSMMIGATAIGVVASSFITSRIISVGKLYQSYVFGYLMVGFVIICAFMTSVWISAVLLFLIGVAGGIFLIPLNTMLQEVGKDLIGSGKTIAIQNFVENTLTVSGLLIFKGLVSSQLSIQLSVVFIGIILLCFIVVLSVQVGKIKKQATATAIDSESIRM